jgi:hypothetical protein
MRPPKSSTFWVVQEETGANGLPPDCAILISFASAGVDDCLDRTVDASVRVVMLWTHARRWAGIKAKGRVHLKNALDRRSRNRGLCGRIRPPHLFARISSQRNHFFYLPSVLEDDCKYAQRNRSRKARRFSHMSGLQHAGNVLCRYAERGARLTAQGEILECQ